MEFALNAQFICNAFSERVYAVWTERGFQEVRVYSQNNAECDLERFRAERLANSSKEIIQVKQKISIKNPSQLTRCVALNLDKLNI